jgi:cysteine desulfurase
VAVELAIAELEETAAHTKRLRDELEKRILAECPSARVNGGAETRAPHIANISFPGMCSDVLTMHLDLAGVYCSTGSACNTGVATPSHVLRAMGIRDDLAGAAVRFSFSRDNDATDVDRVLEVLPEIVARVRSAEGSD